MNELVKKEISNAIAIKAAPVATKLSRVLGRGQLILMKHSPEILMTVGVAGIVGSTILACKATLKCEETLDRAKDKLERINECWDKVKEGDISLDEYSEQDHKKDLTVTYIQTAVDFIKLYGPALTLGIASVSCIVGAHGIMRKRNVALMAAYKVIEEGFSTYRARVKEEYGEEIDYMFKHNLTDEVSHEIEIDEDGKKKKVVKKHLVGRNPDDEGLSVYAQVFSKATTPEWSPGEGYNLAYVTGQQTYFNTMLDARGHVFLNEVYDGLGFKRTVPGSVVGWSRKGNKESYIDFGLNNAYLGRSKDSITLDFNVDGVIYDMI